MEQFLNIDSAVQGNNRPMQNTATQQGSGAMMQGGGAMPGGQQGGGMQQWNNTMQRDGGGQQGGMQQWDNTMQWDGGGQQGGMQQWNNTMQRGNLTQQWNSPAQPDSQIIVRQGSGPVSPEEANELQQRIQRMEQFIVDNQSRTLQERLTTVLGRYVVCEFLVGTQVMYTRSGIMSQVGQDYFVLYDPYEQNFVGCDAYALKFITIFPEGVRPGPMNDGERQEYLERLKNDQRNRIVYAPTADVWAGQSSGMGERVPVLLLSEDQMHMG